MQRKLRQLCTCWGIKLRTEVFTLEEMMCRKFRCQLTLWQIISLQSTGQNKTKNICNICVAIINGAPWLAYSMLLIAVCHCVSQRKKCASQAVVQISITLVKLHSELCSRRDGKIASYLVLLQHMMRRCRCAQTMLLRGETSLRQKTVMRIFLSCVLKTFVLSLCRISINFSLPSFITVLTLQYRNVFQQCIQQCN